MGYVSDIAQTDNANARLVEDDTYAERARYVRSEIVHINEQGRPTPCANCTSCTSCSNEMISLNIYEIGTTDANARKGYGETLVVFVLLCVLRRSIFGTSRGAEVEHALVHE